MSERFLERLSGFTPDASGLDRDALLFAAGRASAHPNRGLTAVVGLLAATQALSLVLFLRPPPPPTAQRWAGTPAATSPGPAPAFEGDIGRTIWSTRDRVRLLEMDDRPLRGVSFIDRGPPLRAFPLPSPLAVN